jgi:hypothetical protein
MAIQSLCTRIGIFGFLALKGYASGLVFYAMRSCGPILLCFVVNLTSFGSPCDWYFVKLSICDSMKCRSLVGQRPQLSFKHIYGQRAQVPGAIIIDGWSYKFLFCDFMILLLLMITFLF